MTKLKKNQKGGNLVCPSDMTDASNLVGKYLNDFVTEIQGADTTEKVKTAFDNLNTHKEELKKAVIAMPDEFIKTLNQRQKDKMKEILGDNGEVDNLFTFTNYGDLTTGVAAPATATVPVPVAVSAPIPGPDATGGGKRKAKKTSKKTSKKGSKKMTGGAKKKTLKKGSKKISKKGSKKMTGGAKKKTSKSVKKISKKNSKKNSKKSSKK